MRPRQTSEQAKLQIKAVDRKSERRRSLRRTGGGGCMMEQRSREGYRRQLSHMIWFSDNVPKPWSTKTHTNELWVRTRWGTTNCAAQKSQSCGADSLPQPMGTFWCHCPRCVPSASPASARASSIQRKFEHKQHEIEKHRVSSKSIHTLIRSSRMMLLQ